MNIKFLIALLLVFWSFGSRSAQINQSDTEVRASDMYSRVSGLWCSDEKFRGCALLDESTCEASLTIVFSNCQNITQDSLDNALSRAEGENAELPQLLQSEISEIEQCFTSSILSEMSLDRASFDECLKN